MRRLRLLRLLYGSLAQAARTHGTFLLWCLWTRIDPCSGRLAMQCLWTSLLKDRRTIDRRSVSHLACGQSQIERRQLQCAEDFIDSVAGCCQRLVVPYQLPQPCAALPPARTAPRRVKDR